MAIIIDLLYIFRSYISLKHHYPLIVFQFEHLILTLIHLMSNRKVAFWEIIIVHDIMIYFFLDQEEIFESILIF